MVLAVYHWTYYGFNHSCFRVVAEIARVVQTVGAAMMAPIPDSSIPFATAIAIIISAAAVLAVAVPAPVATASAPA